MRKILTTGGAGFVGSVLVHYIINETSDTVVVVDELTRAGNPTSLASAAQSERFVFEKVDIRDRAELARIFTEHQPGCVMHLATEDHVDRSIDGLAVSIETNIVGTYALFEVVWAYWIVLTEDKKSAFRFHHISIGKVYGNLHSTDDFLTRTMPYAPSSSYSVSKASNNHLVRTWLRAYGLPMLITNCSNNCGPYHFPERLIPLIILNALTGKLLSVYGNGWQIRDWLYVKDHARALYCVATTGKVGETYNTGGYNECKNLEVVETIYELLEELAPDKSHDAVHYRDLTIFVANHPGHDLRCAVDTSKIARELDWLPQEILESGMREMVQWHSANGNWRRQVQDGNHQGERLGLNS